MKKKKSKKQHTTVAKQKSSARSSWDKQLRESFERLENLIDQAMSGKPLELSAEQIANAKDLEKQKALSMNKHPAGSLLTDYDSRTEAILTDEQFWKDKSEQLTNAVNNGILSDEEMWKVATRVRECQVNIRDLSFSLKMGLPFAIYALDNAISLGNPITFAEGQAKQSHIKIEKLLKEWSTLFEILPDEDHLLPVLSLLSKLKKEVELQFPGMNRVFGNFEKVHNYPK